MLVLPSTFICVVLDPSSWPVVDSEDVLALEVVSLSVVSEPVEFADDDVDEETPGPGSTQLPAPSWYRDGHAPPEGYTQLWLLRSQVPWTLLTMHSELAAQMKPGPSRQDVAQIPSAAVRRRPAAARPPADAAALMQRRNPMGKAAFRTAREG